MNQLLLGAVAMASLTAGLFFLRFWRSTRDRFFLFFAIAFGVEGVNRAILGVTTHAWEGAPIIYLVRLLAFGLIFAAIVDKNLARRKA